jgi:hypothetical protein
VIERGLCCIIVRVEQLDRIEFIGRGDIDRYNDNRRSLDRPRLQRDDNASHCGVLVAADHRVKHGSITATTRRGRWSSRRAFFIVIRVF